MTKRRDFRELLRLIVVYRDRAAFTEAKKMFVGCCPRCGRVFEKKQPHAVYCGKSCADVVSKRNQRKRVK